MEQKLNIYLPLDFDQLLALIKQLPKVKKEQLVELLEREIEKEDEGDPIETHLASESVLARDWNTPEEDEVWQNL